MRALGRRSPCEQVAPQDRGLRARVISLVHRMVECLGPAALPALPAGMRALLPPEAPAPALADVLALLHQLAVRFKAALEPLLAEVAPLEAFLCCMRHCQEVDTLAAQLSIAKCTLVTHIAVWSVLHISPTL